MVTQMVMVYLGIGMMAGFFSGFAVYLASNSFLLSLAAYSGAGFLALTLALTVALIRDALRNANRGDIFLFPAE